MMRIDRFSRRRTCFQRLNVEGRRDGQAMVEVAFAFILFVIVVFMIFDAAWMFYHYLVLTQGVTRTARFAGTNRFTETEIRDYFYRSVPVTMVTSTNPSNHNLRITTVAEDLLWASAYAPGGRPSVTIQVFYDHRFFLPVSFDGTNISATSTGMMISASSSAMITTWPESPDVIF